MNRDEARQLLPIIQAYSEGKEIEELALHSDCWKPVGPDPLFHHAARYYRIKPEPVECWAVVIADNAVIATYRHKKHADSHASDMLGNRRVIRMREVL